MNVKFLLASSLLMVTLPAAANNLFKPIELTDWELAQLRGRYVLPDRIISFGVTMSSSWQNNAGQVIGATVTLNVTSGQIQPSLSITPIDQAGNGGQPLIANGQIIGGAGLNSIQGLTQSVRTAGDFNRGVNDLAIEIGTGATKQPQPADQPWTNGQSFSNEAGKVTITAINGGLQLALHANNNQGFAQQQIGGKGIAQQANIAGAMNDVHNMTALNVVLRDSYSKINMETFAWEQLRALRPTGY